MFISPKIVEDWGDGYKLVLDVSNAGFESIDNWSYQIPLEGSIRASYGVDTKELEGDKVNITGRGGWQNLSAGKSIQAVLIVDRVSESVDNSNFKDLKDEVIDLKDAIAQAKPGDTISLGDRTYNTSGIVIDKQITIDGGDKAIINGGSNIAPVFTLYGGASGSIIKNLTITDANVAVKGFGAKDINLDNLDISDIGLDPTIRSGLNNTAVMLDRADGAIISNSDFSDIGRKAIGLNDSNGGSIFNNTIEGVNLDAKHSQAHDVAGVKLYNTNAINVFNNTLKDINGYNLWADTSNKTIFDGNRIENVGDRFKPPDFTNFVDAGGIYNEKSSNSIVKNNQASALDGFDAFISTEFSTESLSLQSNDFNSIDLTAKDYWIDEATEKAIALTEDPLQLGFDVISDSYYAQSVV